MLGELGRYYRVGWIEAIGTDARYPVTEGWPYLVEQLIDEIERARHGAPVFAAGHSLGGYLTLLAALKRPRLFRAVVLLDAPVIGPLRGRMLGATKLLGIVDRVTPAGAVRERRSRWDTREQARQHFRTRRLFRHFTEQCLEDYVRHGLVRENGELRLVIDPAIEYRIYRTIPHAMSRGLGALRVPAGFAVGERSDVARRAGLAATRRLGPVHKVSGGHLFPFEHPREAAAAVHELLSELSR